MSSEHSHEELDGIHPGFGDPGRGCAGMLEHSVVTRNSGLVSQRSKAWPRVAPAGGFISAEMGGIRGADRSQHVVGGVTVPN